MCSKKAFEESTLLPATEKSIQYLKFSEYGHNTLSYTMVEKLSAVQLVNALGVMELVMKLNFVRLAPQGAIHLELMSQMCVSSRRTNV